MIAYAESKQKMTSKDTIQKKETKKTDSSQNTTGIPNSMKSHFENISGFSFDDVRIHYNSDKPKQLQALAYTQGNQVYVGPGQERHLGHELGHVVQQKQGRVTSTMNLNGIQINDNSAMEKEADAIYNGSHRFTDSSNNPSEVIQYMTYVRGLQRSSAENDISKLNRELGIQDDDGSLFSKFYGGMLASVTRYNEGQKKYYSPVGYIIDIEDESKVWANFAGDGNTGTLGPNHFNYEFNFKDKLDEEIASMISDDATPKDKRDRLKFVQKIRTYNKEHGSKEDNDVGKKIAATELIKEFYKSETLNEKPLGEGFNLDGLAESEASFKSDENEKYTESKVAITKMDVKGAYYNDNHDDGKLGWNKIGESFRTLAIEKVKNNHSLDKLYKINESGELVDG